VTPELPVVVLCGRPNVGKSSLFNALLKRRVAIVDPTAGVTRDRVMALAERPVGSFQLVDTGGLGLFDEIALKDEVERQIGIALELADLVVFVVDAKEGVSPHDAQIARRLRTLGKPIVLAVNKADGASLERDANLFRRLGFGEPVAVSAIERFNVEELFERILEEISKAGLAAGEPDDEGVAPPIKLAIVGKVNSGKSTFVNRIVGEERVIVSSIAGTTRDAIDAPFEHRGRRFIAIDTAGLRKRRVVENTPDFYGQGRAAEAIRRCDVVVLFVDAERDISQIDKGLAAQVARSSKPLVIAVTKWDLAAAAGRQPEDYTKYLKQQLPLLEFAPVVFVSTHQGLNVHAVLDLVVEVHEQAGHRAATGPINRAVEQAFSMQAPRTGRGKFPKILYATQVGVHPPTIVVFVNDKKMFGDEWARFLANRLREVFPFGEVPVRIWFRERRREPGKPLRTGPVDGASDEEFEGDAVDALGFDEQSLIAEAESFLESGDGDEPEATKPADLDSE
jgi:GTP-binding protein